MEKDIPGFKDYKITEYGEVISYKKKTPTIIKHSTGKETHPMVFIQKDNKPERLCVYYLVAITYLVNPRESKLIKHKDGNIFNNHYTNLEWDNTVWKDIPGFSKYQISENGEIMSYQRGAPKLTKFKLGANGHYLATLAVLEDRKNFKVHELMASAFLDNPDNYKHIIHIDGNLKNNKLSNLKMSEYPICMNEKLIWKDIQGFPKYKISEFGDVVSFHGYPMLLKAGLNDEEYYCVNLYNNSISCSYYLQRLVALHFIENPDNKPLVDHIDNNRCNNH